MSNNKMKGLLKGLRYISQIFDNEKEPEMQIGFPTDVKHVAHIGWDGPSVNSPSWMEDFSAPQEFGSSPMNLNGEAKDDSTVNWGSQDSSRKGCRKSNYPACAPGSPARDLPELPKSTRRNASKGESGSPTKEKSDKLRQPRRSARNHPNKDLSQRSESSSSLPDVPKKSSRRKKTKETAKSRPKANASDIDTTSEPGSVSKYLRGEKCPYVDDESETASICTSRNSTESRLDEDEEKGFTGIS